MRQYAKDSKWRGLRAAREGRVYFVPYEPFAWLDRPASFMRFIGVQWLAQKLHPERFSIDLEAETGRFLRLFFRLDLSREQIKRILNP
jgi:iron complex transport system substrate-binding protein